MELMTREKKSDGTKKLVGRIELSEKVLTGQEQILNTVAHEMCHCAYCHLPLVKATTDG